MVPPAPKRSSSGCGVNTRIVLSRISSRRGSSAPVTAATAIRISRAEQRRLILVSLCRLRPQGGASLLLRSRVYRKIARTGTANLWHGGGCEKRLDQVLVSGQLLPGFRESPICERLQHSRGLHAGEEPGNGGR